MKRLPLRWCFLIGLPVMWSVPIWAQSTPPEVRIVTRQDGHVYVYHTADVPLDHGIRLLRITGRDTVAVTDTTLFAARDAVEFEALAGPDAMAVLSEFLDADRPADLFLRFRGDPLLSRAWTFVHPGVARALGRLAVDSTAAQGSRVLYRIEIVNELGERAGPGLEASTLLMPTSPSVPSGVEATNTADRLEISWSYAQSANMEDNVNEFRVYVSGLGQGSEEEDEGKRVARNNAVDRFTYRLPVSASAAGTSVRVRVSAVDVTGQQSEPSESLEYTLVDKSLPATPVGVSARYLIEEDQVEVTWTASTDPGVSGYHVYRAMSTQDPEGFEQVTDQPIDIQEPIYVEDATDDDVALFFKVLAVDQAGNESELSAAAMVIVRDVSPPAAPQTVSAEILPAGSVRLSWPESSSPDVRMYVVARRHLFRGASSNFVRLTEDGFRLTSFEDGAAGSGGLLDGTSYQYAVVAVDSSYNVSDSTFVEVQAPDGTPPDAPRGLAAENDRGFRVWLSWNPPIARDVAEFVVYRETEGGQAAELARAGGRDYRIQDEDVEPGQTYAYFLSAVDSTGNEGARSPGASLRFSDLTPPRSVRNVRASCLEGGGVTLSWEPVPDEDLAGYEVLRSEIPTGIFSPVSGGLVQSTEWMDPSGANGSWYRIVAVDTSGERSAPSRSAGACAAGKQE